MLVKILLKLDRQHPTPLLAGATRLSRARACAGAQRSLSALQSELIERAEQLGRIAIDTKCSGTQKLGFTVTPAQQPDAQDARAARCEQIPDSIADDVALSWRKAESLQAGEKEVRLGF